MFKYFFYTKDFLPKEAEGMGLFTVTHFVELLIAAVLIALTAFLFKKCNGVQRNRFLFVMVILLIADELVKQIGSAVLGMWEVGFLPLHICSVNIILAAEYYFTKSKVTAQLMYCLGVPGAIIALVIPTWSKLPVANFMHLHSYTVHILLAIFPILLIINGERPDIKYLPKCCLAISLYSVPVYFINIVLKTDFMFLNGAKGTPFTGLVKAIGKPLYCPLLVLLICGLMALMYLPWVIYDKQKAKSIKA